MGHFELAPSLSKDDLQPPRRLCRGNLPRRLAADRERTQHNPMCTGLGLAIVKYIAQTHHISLRVDSQIGQGTTLTLIFPPV